MRILKGWRLIGVAGLTLILLVYFGLTISYELRGGDGDLLRRVLRLSSLPSSVANVACTSPITTDAITDCYFSMTPEDLPQLLVGYRFSEFVPGEPREGRTVPKGGTTFPVHRIHAADLSGDPEFHHGGFVALYVGVDRTRARAYYYAE